MLWNLLTIMVYELFWWNETKRRRYQRGTGMGEWLMDWECARSHSFRPTVHRSSQQSVSRSFSDQVCPARDDDAMSYGQGQVSCERLISLVKERPPLYDCAHPAHYNRDVTSRLWADIATRLSVSGKHSILILRSLSVCLSYLWFRDLNRCSCANVKSAIYYNVSINFAYYCL